MTYQGRVRNGVIVLAKGAKLPDGTVVAVQPLPVKPRRKKPVRGRTPLAAALLEFAGCVNGLPADLARNHDHYLYGVPKK